MAAGCSSARGMPRLAHRLRKPGKFIAHPTVIDRVRFEEASPAHGAEQAELAVRHLFDSASDSTGRPVGTVRDGATQGGAGGKRRRNPHRADTAHEGCPAAAGRRDLASFTWGAIVGHGSVLCVFVTSPPPSS